MTSQAVARIIQAAQSAGQPVNRVGDTWRTPCLAHQGEDPNLAISEGEGGRLLVTCHSHHCRYEDILIAYGLSKSDVSVTPSEVDPWMPCQSPRNRIPCTGHKEEEDRYHDEEWNLLFAVCRCSRKGEGCTQPFAQWQPADNVHGKIWNLRGVRRVIYQLPRVIAAVQQGETVWICEGEKSVRRLMKEGLVATTNPMGAGKWQKSFAKWFRNAKVKIVADRDDSGVDHAWFIVDSLKGIASEIEVFQTPIDRKGADVFDHLESGFSLDELIPCPRPVVEEDLHEEEKFDRLALIDTSTENKNTPETVPIHPKNEEDENDLGQLLAQVAVDESVWEFDHMRPLARAADSLHVRREGMAALVLNRAALLAGPTVVGRIDDRDVFHLGSINALVGRSGAGSNVTRKGAERLLPAPPVWRDIPRKFESETEVELQDFGMECISPANGSTLVSRMQRRVSVASQDDGPGKQTIVHIPRVSLSYTEGSMLISSMRKSGHSSTQAASLEPLILDGFAGSTLRADVADAEVRESIPDGSYVMAVDAYFQAEIVGEALTRTTGLAQRLRVVPIKRPQGDPEVVKAGKILVAGGQLSDEDLSNVLSRRPVGPEFPGELTNVVHFLTESEHYRGYNPVVMQMPARMAKELQVITASLREGLADEDPLATHTGLNMYKTAAQSALLRCSHKINMDDWYIAKEFARIAREARDIAMRWAEQYSRKEESEETRRAARRARAVENSRALGNGSVPGLVKRLADRYLRKLQTDGPLTATKLRDSISPKDVAEWNESEGEGGKTGLHKAVLVYGGNPKNVMFVKNDKKYMPVVGHK